MYMKHKYIYIYIYTHTHLHSYLLTYLLTYLLPPWSRVLLEKLTGLQLVKKFPAFHGTRKFITAPTSVRHLSLSWATPIQSIYPHPTSWRSILILFTLQRLRLPGSLLPSVFHSKTLCTPLSSTKGATFRAHLILSDFIRRKILGEEYKLHTPHTHTYTHHTHTHHTQHTHSRTHSHHTPHTHTSTHTHTTHTPHTYTNSHITHTHTHHTHTHTNTHTTHTSHHTPHTHTQHTHT